MLANKLANIKIDIILSSPLSRAIKTAQYIANKQPQKPDIKIKSYLKEIDCGTCTGLTKDEIQRQYPSLIVNWQNNTDPPFPKGESLKDVEARAIPNLIDILENNPNKTILLSGHGSLNIAIIGYFLKVPYGLRFKIHQSNCALNEIDFTSKDNFSIRYINL